MQEPIILIGAGKTAELIVNFFERDTGFGIAFLIPLGVLIVMCIYIDSPGQVVFAHKRVGQYGKIFPCYKFWTMVPNAESVLQEYLAKNPDTQKE